MTDVPPNSDQMLCRACGRQERASEGYPCQKCSTFLCVLCNMRGVTMCSACQAKAAASPPVPPTTR